MQAAEGALEDREIELVAALHARTVGRLPPGGTEEERLAAVTEILKEDPEALDLYARLKLIEHFGGGYLRTLQGLQLERERRDSNPRPPA